MIVYWLLLLPTAFVAYIFGSMDTMVIASNFFFRHNLRRLGTGNRWLSNFRRIFGIPGFIKLAIAEILKDLIPILIGGMLLGIKDHADVGRPLPAFAWCWADCTRCSTISRAAMPASLWWWGLSL